MSMALPNPVDCCNTCPTSECGNPINLSNVIANITQGILEVTSVKSYGAKGDGATDDTAAIQAALDTGDPAIFFPPGTYMISSTLTITTDFQMLIGVSGGANTYTSIVKALVAGIQMFYVTASAVTMDHLTIQGDGSHPAGDGTTNGIYYNTLNVDAQLTNCHLTDMRNCVVVKGTNFTVTGTSFISSWQGVTIDAFGAGEARGYIIQNCRFHGMRNICIYLTPGAAIFNVLIDANFYDGNNICKIIIGEVSDCQITNNHVNRLINSFVNLTNNNAGTISFPPYTMNPGSILIANNSVLFLDLFDYGDGIYTHGDNCIIKDNTVIGARHYAIRADDGDNCIVEGNQILHCFLHGLILNNLKHTTVSGNLIYDWGKDTTALAEYQGIYIYGNCDSLLVSNNQVRNPAITAQQKNAILCNPANVFIMGNYVDTALNGITVYDVPTQPTNSVILNNVLYNCTNGIVDAATDLGNPRTHLGNVFKNCVTPMAAGTGEVISTDMAPITLTDAGKIL